MTTNVANYVETVGTPRKKGLSWGRVLAWAFLIGWILLTLLPMYWIARMAFSTQRDLLGDPTSLLPVNFTIDAFKRVLGLVPVNEAIAQGGSTRTLHFWTYLRNTVLVAGITTASGLFFSAMAAYAFARLRFPWRDQIFFVYLVALVMPAVLNLIPNFVLIYQLGWVGTLWGILAPTVLGNAFSVFFLRQFFLGINHELEEAARLDGASFVGVFWRIVLPVSAPALATLAILSFMGAWNEFQWAYFAGGMGNKEDATVLTVALAAFRAQQQSGVPDYTGMMAGTLISILPMLVLFLILGRRVIDSIQFSGFR